MLRSEKKKHWKSTKAFYVTNFGHKEPFRVLLDPIFVTECAKLNLDITKTVQKVFSDEKFNLYMSSCSKKWLEERIASTWLGDRNPLEWLNLNKVEFFECDHSKRNRTFGKWKTEKKIPEEQGEDNASSQELSYMYSDKCILTYASNSNSRKFWYCAEDSRLVNQLKIKKGVPVINLVKNKIHVFEPSRASVERHEFLERKKLGVTATEQEMLDQLEAKKRKLKETSKTPAKKRPGKRAKNQTRGLQ